MDQGFTSYGIGVGLRPPHHKKFLQEHPNSVTWVEVVSENFMPWQNYGFGSSLNTLIDIRKNYSVALHGVSMNIGSADKVNFDYLKRLKSLVEIINPIIVSDHISWTGVGGKNMHDLMPLPYTEDVLKHIVQKIDCVQNYLGRRILLENPSSYFEFSGSSMSEVEFINLLTKNSGCGLLLDVNNVYVSSVNHGFDPKKYIDQVDWNRVGQIHLAGHSTLDGYLIDTHDHPICDDVWNLYQYGVQKYGARSVMIERDGNIPEWAEFENEVLKLKGMQYDNQLG